MRAVEFWRAVTVDRVDLLRQVLDLFEREHVRYCVIGGLAVNAYVEPVVTLDLDVVLAADDFRRVEPALAAVFSTERFPQSFNVSLEGSDLRVQIQTDPRYAPCVDRASRRAVLGVDLPVASLPDVLQGKVWAVQDETRRASKRQKDLADIARLLEAFPHLRVHVPEDVLSRLI
jgi:Nucleotidyl transferase AbiEii toxin, Type IV TA system